MSNHGEEQQLAFAFPMDLTSGLILMYVCANCYNSQIVELYGSYQSGWTDAIGK